MKFETRPEIQQILDTLPTNPGVYLMKDERGDIIYVGKAINLRNRVRSYFHSPYGQDAKVWRLVERIRNIEFIVTESELEALVLECNLIKKYKPHFNVRLKDDKRYPYIKVTWQEPFPKVFVTRRMENDGARYFGPFTAVWAVHETMDTLRRIFPYLTCDREITGKDKRACLYYDIGLCIAPCIGASTRDEYRAMIDRLCMFLQGKTEEVTTSIHAKLDEAVGKLEFERAARYRDQLQALARIAEHQKVVSMATVDQDVVAFERDAAIRDNVFIVPPIIHFPDKIQYDENRHHASNNPEQIGIENIACPKENANKNQTDQRNQPMGHECKPMFSLQQPNCLTRLNPIETKRPFLLRLSDKWQRFENIIAPLHQCIEIAALKHIQFRVVH